MIKTFRKKTTLMTPIFFAYCKYEKISDIRRLPDGNHRTIGGLSDNNNRVINI